MSIATVGSDGSGLGGTPQVEVGNPPPRWDATGQHVYCLRSAGDAYELIRIPFPKARRRKPLTLIPGLLTRSFVIAADDNRLVYNREARHSNLWRLALTPELAPPWETPNRSTQGQAFIQSVAVAPDGRALAYSSGAASALLHSLPRMRSSRIRSDIFVVDAQGQTRQLTHLGNRKQARMGRPTAGRFPSTSPVEGTARIWIRRCPGRPGAAASVDVAFRRQSPDVVSRVELLYRSQDGANFVTLIELATRTFSPAGTRCHSAVGQVCVRRSPAACGAQRSRQRTWSLRSHCRWEESPAGDDGRSLSSRLVSRRYVDIRVRYLRGNLGIQRSVPKRVCRDRLYAPIGHDRGGNPGQ